MIFLIVLISRCSLYLKEVTTGLVWIRFWQYLRGRYLNVNHASSAQFLGRRVICSRYISHLYLNAMYIIYLLILHQAGAAKYLAFYVFPSNELLNRFIYYNQRDPIHSFLHKIWLLIHPTSFLHYPFEF